MSLTSAIEILRAVNSAADAFQPLKGATGGALYIAESVKKFKKRKEDWKNFSEYIQTYVAFVMKFIPEDSSKTKDDWVNDLGTLNSVLSSISTKIENLQKEKGFKNLWRQFSTGAEVIQDLQRDFDNAIRLCQFQLTVTTTSELANQLQGGSAERIVAKLLAIFREDIVSEMTFGRLADPIGTSWNPARACLPGTRTIHCDEIFMWISAAENKSDGNAEIFLIADAPGTGKTALAHAACERAHKEGHLIASFFFNRFDAEQATPRNLLGSIIRGLCSINTQVKKAIARRLDADETLATAPPSRQFKELILPICHMLPANHPLAVIIDALDEGCDAELLEILRDSVPLLPRMFRIIITSRPEERIMTYLNKRHVRRSSHPLSGAENRHDIAVFVDNKLRHTSWGGSVSLKLKTEFVSKTEGLFLWAAAVLNHLEQSFKPISELQNLLDNTSESWHEDKDAESKLDDLYYQILSSFKWSDQEFGRAYKTVMGAVVTVKEPLSIYGLFSMYAQECISIEDITRILTRMQSFFAGFDPNAPNKPIHILHLSVREYLTRRAPSPYHLDEHTHHSVLAGCCLAVIDKELLLVNIPELGYTKGDWDAHHVPWIPKVERESMSEQLWYSCQFFPDHALVVCKDVPLSLVQSTQNMLSKKSRLLLEITASMGRVIDLGAVRKWTLNIPALCEEMSRNDTIDEEIASCLFPISKCLLRHRRFEEAFMAVEDTVEIHRRLAADRPDTFEPHLAVSLICLCNCLSGLGRHTDALKAIEDAVDICRRLATDRPAEFEPTLARSLNNLARCLAGLGRHTDALEAIKSSLEIRRRLASINPTAFEPEVAQSLINLCASFSGLGRHTDALQVGEEAVEINRRLATKKPAIFEPAVTMALQNLSAQLARLGHHTDALKFIREAVEIHHRLAANQPAVFEPDFPNTLNDLSDVLVRMGRHAEALEVIERAIEMHHRLVPNQPAVFEANLPYFLDTLFTCYAGLGRHTEALKAIEDAVEIQRRFSANQPNVFEPNLGLYLHNLSTCLSNLGNNADALDAIEEAMEIRRRLAASQPAAFEPVLAESLDTLSSHLTKLERRTDALVAIENAVEIRRRVAANQPTTPSHDLAQSLNNLSACLAALGRHEDALNVAQEARSIFA